MATRAYEVARYIRECNIPGDMRVGSLLAILDDLLARGATSTCRRCGQPIQLQPDEKWSHLDPDRSRGCRAASYTEESGWNDALDRSWLAAS